MANIEPKIRSLVVECELTQVRANFVAHLPTSTFQPMFQSTLTYQSKLMTVEELF